jgi:lysophospholipase L1-like esterase
VVVVGAVCFSVWALLTAPALLRAAETSPLGARRTASLAVLRPLARVSSFFGLDRLGSGADRALGRLNAEPEIPPAGPILPPVRDPQPGDPSTPGLQPLLSKPTGEDPLRVLVVGDSIGADLAFGMDRLLDGREAFRPRSDTEESSGLARPDYFNWPYRIAVDLGRWRPDVVVVMFGGNDNQSFLVDGEAVIFGTAEWRAVYRSRVSKVMELVTGAGRPMIWVGMPIMKDPGRSKQMRTLNAVFQAEAARHPGVEYVDSYDIFDGARGRYSAYLRDSSGRQQEVREGDGIHLTIGAGGTMLAQEVFEVMKTFWLVPTTPLPTSVPDPGTVPHGRMAPGPG